MMGDDSDDFQQDRILAWCRGIVGSVAVEQTTCGSHGRSSAIRLRTRSGRGYYAKIHRHKAYWHQEVHAYRNWVGVFGTNAPALIDVYEPEPRAILTSAAAGRSASQQLLSMPEERQAWEDAGHHLAMLHNSCAGEFFGPCRADGKSAAAPRREAVEYATAQLDAWELTAGMASPLDHAAERAIKAARERLPAFAGERPVPCHRDYGPANWLVNGDGKWVGVVDFEMAHWDVRVADFARYPNWEWIRRPDLIEALLAGYGHSLSEAEHDQLYCKRVIFALSVIAWGTESKHLSFAEEGRQALRRLAKMV